MPQEGGDYMRAVFIVASREEYEMVVKEVALHNGSNDMPLILYHKGKIIIPNASGDLVVAVLELLEN